MEQIIEKRTRQRRSNQQILQLLEEFEKSKATVKDFCKKHGISTGNFHKWKSRYRSKSVIKSKASGFAAIDVVSSPQVVSHLLFAEVGSIKIYQPVSATFLKSLL
jgi:transposase-like protein